MPRHDNRQAVEVARTRLSDTQALYDVTMTNGSGTRVLTLAGTQWSVWVLACRMGEQPGSNLAGYVPVDIEQAGTSSAAFAVAS